VGSSSVRTGGGKPDKVSSTTRGSSAILYNMEKKHVPGLALVFMEVFYCVFVSSRYLNNMQSESGEGLLSRSLSSEPQTQTTSRAEICSLSPDHSMIVTEPRGQRGRAINLLRLPSNTKNRIIN
jgi:hypothetical protein